MWCISHQIVIALVRSSSLGREIMANRSKKTIRTSVILPEDAYARVQAVAETNDVSTAWVIRHAIQRFLEGHVDQTELPLQLPRKAVGER